ncbi:MAG: FAD-dependent monooxygenase, partial [Kiloniellales bacterium]|nr:FAD-dependent monooxygenase [Kiloniellales bacterium]
MLAKADEAVPEYQSIESDVIVAGGGPAGVLTAILLARRNHSVVLLTGGRSRPRIEGLSQRVLDALRAQGLEAAASAVGPEVERLA